MTTTAQLDVQKAQGAVDGGNTGMTTPEGSSESRPAASVWTGRVMSGLVIAFLLLASVLPKLFLPQVAEESMRELGWQPKHLLLIAAIELTGTLLYAIPRTAPLGALLLTGLLGGAVATHLRVEHPVWSHTLFPAWVGLLMWGGLYLRSADLRAFLRHSLMGRRNDR